MNVSGGIRITLIFMRIDEFKVERNIIVILKNIMGFMLG